MSYWRRFNIMEYAEDDGRRELPASPGAYAIYFDNRLVYVGQSANVKARISGYRFRHSYGRDIHTPWGDVPNSVSITAKVKCSRRLGDWAMWEIRLIARLRPRFNTHHLNRRAA